jgi:hypothetical protein
VYLRPNIRKAITSKIIDDLLSLRVKPNQFLNGSMFNFIFTKNAMRLVASYEIRSRLVKVWKKILQKMIFRTGDHIIMDQKGYPIPNTTEKSLRLVMGFGLIV